MAPPFGTTVGQVCDRCRQKKIKCDGTSPTCTNCKNANVECQVSAKLQRKTKIRGFLTSSEATIKQLQAENERTIKQLQEEKDATVNRLQQENEELKFKNEQLLKQLEDERSQSKRLKQELDQHSPDIQRPRKASRRRLETSRAAASSSRASLSGDSEVSGSLQRTAYVIKHMGRLVHDDFGIGRFAGSTTGVHFVSSVEDQCRRIRPSTTPFPEACFRLHLFEPKFSGLTIPTAHDGTFQSSFADTVDSWTLRREIRAVLPHPLQFYAHQIDAFNENWEAVCPVIVKKQLVDQLRILLSTDGQSSERLSDSEYACFQSILLILVINEMTYMEDDEGGTDTESSHASHMKVIHRLLVRVVSRADLFCLQSLILFGLFVQLTGQNSCLIQINGILVRIAQSLGLHRHARRFRFGDAEVELRKRMWWWVYVFDKITSIVHGLPKLISDSDVDNDLPIDCYLDGVSLTSLSHPLPGEPTPVSLFVQYVQLARILSSVLDQLYTTTHRRGGAEKIERLERDLRVWSYNFNNHPHVFQFDVGAATNVTSRIRSDRHSESETFIMTWLQLLANLAMILIHRPGLTFDSNTPQFRDSLKSCVRCCSAILTVLGDPDASQLLRQTAPFGPNQIFQCCLMHVYAHCNIDSSEYLSTKSASQSMITDGISVLSQMNGAAESDQSLLQIIHFLENLSQSFLKPTPEATGGADMVTQQPQEMTYLNPGSESISFDPWNESVLGNLNQLDVFDWTFETTSPFPPI